MLTLNDGRSELWQWDTGRTLAVDAECSQVHFSNKVFGRSVDVDVVGGVAAIPDILLQTDKELTVWAFVGTADNGYTKISKVFKVNKRNKPADYVFTPVEQTTIDEIAAIAQSVRDDADAGLFNGEDGATFIPYVSADGIISWTNDKELPNPEPVNIKGVKGDKGDKGDRGLQGVQGIQGERGAQGLKGDKGDRGEQGIQGVQGLKGETGARGKDGADGYTPVKGKDYFTESDKAEMVQAVISALPNAEGVGF